jgi:undecaprenyl-diphosphatase
VTFVAAVITFVAIAEDLVDGGGLISHDEAILRWFVEHRTEWMISIARTVSILGQFLSLLCIGVLLGLWLWSRAWPLAIAPALALVVAGLASTIAKAAFGRARPPIAIQETHVSSPAFPSGHAADAAAFFLAAAFVLALVVARRRRRQVALIVIGAMCAWLVGLSRLVLAVHWPSDVVAGWALGTATAILIVVVFWLGAFPRTP